MDSESPDSQLDKTDLEKNKIKYMPLRYGLDKVHIKIKRDLSS